MAQQNRTVERRKALRGRVYLGGTLAFDLRSPSVECLVRNLSEDGAKIEFESAVEIPEEFDFYIPRSRKLFRARVIWRRMDEFGLAFVHPSVSPLPQAEAPVPNRADAGEPPTLEHRIRQVTQPRARRAARVQGPEAS